MKKIKTVKYSKSDISKLLVYPEKRANKYSRGTCVVVAGSEKYPGAAILSSLAATKSGSGYTKLYTDKSNYKNIATAIPAIPTAPFSELKIIDTKDNKPCAYLIGPGFDPDEDNTSVVCKILENTNAPVVIDGGAIASISSKKVRDLLEDRHNNNLITILTPHAGEGSKILENYACEDQVNLKEKAELLSELTNSLVVLKDYISYVCDGNAIYEMNSGTSALAKAGSGDVLAGILAGVLCQNKRSAFEVCVLATNIHANAAKLATNELGEISVTPPDLIENLVKSIQLIA